MSKGYCDNYNEIGVSSDVMSASNHRLIQLLMQKCLHHIQSAKAHIGANNVLKKCDSIRKAIDILDYLRICINFNDKQAHEMATQLDSIYLYLEKNLVEANMYNDEKYLDEANKILLMIKDGWDGMEVNHGKAEHT